MNKKMLLFKWKSLCVIDNIRQKGDQYQSGKIKHLKGRTDIALGAIFRRKISGEKNCLGLDYICVCMCFTYIADKRDREKDR